MSTERYYFKRGQNKLLIFSSGSLFPGELNDVVCAHPDCESRACTSRCPVCHTSYCSSGCYRDDKKHREMCKKFKETREFMMSLLCKQCKKLRDQDLKSSGTQPFTSYCKKCEKKIIQNYDKIPHSEDPDIYRVFLEE